MVPRERSDKRKLSSEPLSRQAQKAQKAPSLKLLDCKDAYPFTVIYCCLNSCSSNLVILEQKGLEIS